jgi:hypothetical protein
MENEFQSFIQSKTWSLVKFPKNRKAIKTKWVFKYKPIIIPETDQILIKYKARLVAKGFMQRHGINFDEIYTNVTRSSSYRVIFAWAASRNWFIHSGDVKTAFLNGDLEESVYVHQSEGFEQRSENGKTLVCLFHPRNAGCPLSYG